MWRNCDSTTCICLCKKEEPKETEQNKVETAQTATSEPAQFESLPSAEQNTQQVEIPAHVEVERTETANTTTEIVVNQRMKRLQQHRLLKINLLQQKLNRQKQSQ